MDLESAGRTESGQRSHIVDATRAVSSGLHHHPESYRVPSHSFDRLLPSISLVAIVTAAACAGTNQPVQSSDNLLRVGGTYTTAVTLDANSCSGITVQPNPTIVAHNAGTTTLVLTHAGNAYSGTIQNNGTFTTTTKAIVAGTATHNLSIAGVFTRTGFTATVTVDLTDTQGPVTCRYVVKWVGTKQGSDPNNIPGV